MRVSFKNTPPARLLASLEKSSGRLPNVAGDRPPCSNSIQARAPAEKADYQLTPHEMRLLKLLVDGHNYKTAAKELGVSVNTISFHMRRIYDKLQFTRSLKPYPRPSVTGLFADSFQEQPLSSVLHGFPLLLIQVVT